MVVDHNNSIKIIIDNDLCVSCGACIHICPFSNIGMVYSNIREKWDAEVNDLSKCLKCNGTKNCLYVCPSYNTDYIQLAKSNENNLLGRIRNVYNGYSTDNNRRLKSSSGGFIRELSRSLLESKEINGIISIIHNNGLDYFPEIINDVSKMPNSIYHNVNYENAFRIIKENKKSFLLIGLPCQITSIEKLLTKKKFSHLRERVYAKVAIICGYTFDRVNAQAFAYYNKFNLLEISYRENGRYRKTKISSQDESKIFDPFNPNSLSERINNNLFFDRFLVQNGCLYCVDHIGYCADLVVGDAWQKRYKDDKIGTNIIICRTEKGEEIIPQISNFCFEQGYNEEIIESQSHLYALGTLGEGIKRIKFKDKYFLPDHKRTVNLEDIKVYKYKASDLLKIKVIKRLLRNKKFNTARLFYAVVEFKYLIGYFVKKWANN